MRCQGLLLIFLSIALAQIESEWLVMSKALSCNDSTIFGAIAESVASGDLSSAREIGRNVSPRCQKEVAKTYSDSADRLFIMQDGYLKTIEANLLLLKEDFRPVFRPVAKQDDSKTCWNNTDTSFVGESWDTCCSTLYDFEHESKEECFNNSMPLCCEMFEGSPSHIRLPALREVAIGMRIALDNGEIMTLSFEQEGFLRQFDVSGVLWPAGYFLALCVAAPVKCGIPELSRLLAQTHGQVGPMGIELGSGVGASSISLALALQSRPRNVTESPLIVATDRMPQALALILANSHSHNVDKSISVHQLDHFNVTQVEGLTRAYFEKKRGFSLVLGSSLLSFFDRTTDCNAPLWKALDTLLSPENPDALALFSHTKAEPVHPPHDGSYRLIRRISGDVFQMRTRSSDSSDFEISVFQRNIVLEQEQEKVLESDEL
jgi:hypothetical protein